MFLRFNPTATEPLKGQHLRVKLVTPISRGTFQLKRDGKHNIIAANCALFSIKTFVENKINYFAVGHVYLFKKKTQRLHSLCLFICGDVLLEIKIKVTINNIKPFNVLLCFKFSVLFFMFGKALFQHLQNRSS